MLSSEGSKLARLILARHMLICRAVELNTSSNLHTWGLMHGDNSLTQSHIVRVDAQIEQAWLRLERVSPPKILG